MADTKIRGYRWQFNYRGFDIHYNKTTGWYRAVPDNNLIKNDFATEDHYHVSNDGEMILAMVNDHFEVLEAMTGEDLQGSAVTEDRPDKHYQRDYEACSE